MSNNQIIIPNNNLPICIQKYNFNFKNNDGIINWATVCANPSSKIDKRVWNIVLSGNFLKCSKYYILEADFSKVNSNGYQISLEGPLQGIFIVNSKVYNANDYLGYTWNIETKKLVLYIEKCSKGLFEINININDQVFDCNIVSNDPSSFTAYSLCLNKFCEDSKENRTDKTDPNFLKYCNNNPTSNPTNNPTNPNNSINTNKIKECQSTCGNNIICLGECQKN